MIHRFSHIQAKISNFISKTLIALLTFLLSPIIISGQSLQHPHIWVNQSDRAMILENIKEYSWAKNYFDQLQQRTEYLVNQHRDNPSFVLKTIAPIPGKSVDRDQHNNVLTSASEAAILYYLTEDSSYAKYAADILNHYTERLAKVDSTGYKKGTGILFNDNWLECRVLYPKIAIIYDFVYNYVNNPATKIFDLQSNSYKSFNKTAAQTTVKKLAAIVFKSITARNCNHSILAGNGALFNLLMIDDDQTRENFFQRFYLDPLEQSFDAYLWTLNNFTDQNIWDETLGYSKESHQIVLQSLNIIDRYKPELNIIQNNERILDGYQLYENFFYPNGDVLRFGDSGTESDLTNGYQYLLKLVTQKKLTKYVTKTESILQNCYLNQGGHLTQVITDRLEWNNPLQLLWGVNVLDTIRPTSPKIESTFHIKHAGIVVQRNYNFDNSKENGLMYYSGGATYVHAHSSGIDMELYGKGYVLGAESGSGTYGSDEHENYRVRLAAHNTVIANSSGKRGSNWNSRMSNTELLACEPASGTNPISQNFSFSTQELNDTYNQCDQQRTICMIKTDSISGYYVDIFRSKGKQLNLHHDYIYHNIGDEVTLNYDDNSLVPLNSSSIYSSDEYDSVTGWKFYESVKSSGETKKAINARFKLQNANRYMNVFIPSGTLREYSTALAPTTKGAKAGYDKKKTPIIAIRKKGEAWSQPFIAVYEPTSYELQKTENCLFR